jgi:tyrosyl-tRNA synthetase
MFAKVLSISDELMWRWYTLLSSAARREIARCGRGRRRPQPQGRQGAAGQGDHRRASTARPRPAAPKRTSSAARAAACPTRSPSGAGRRAAGHRRLLKQAGLAPSTSEALRLVEQGGVRIDGAVVSDKA